MPYTPEVDDRDYPSIQAFWSDLWGETIRSLRETPLVGKLALAVGLAGFAGCEFAAVALSLHWFSGLRIVFLCAFIGGAAANARYADEFYRRVYLISCAIALPVSAVLLYAIAAFDIALGSRTLGYLVAIWLVSFVIAFAALRGS